MLQTEHSIFVKALHGNNDNRAPIWLMRQAGRYMPQYRQLRKKYSFIEMVHQPELVCQITKMPIQAFGFDAAIVFSDILVILETLGLSFHIEESVGPIISRSVSTAQEVRSLPRLSVQDSLSYVITSIKGLKQQLEVPLIGFAGSPFTIASYLIEGKASKDLRKTKQWMYQDPEGFDDLLTLIADQTIEYLNAQIDAGADAIQLFDTWACHLSPSQFSKWCSSKVNYIINRLKPCPSIYYCRGSQLFLEQLKTLPVSAISLDWQCDITQMRRQLPKRLALQGNLDPDILYLEATQMCDYAGKILQGMSKDPGFIFNLGHGIRPDVPYDNVKSLVAYVKEFSCYNEE